MIFDSYVTGGYWKMMENYQKEILTEILEEILKVMENYEMGLMFIYVPENDSESDGKLFVFWTMDGWKWMKVGSIYSK